LSLDVFQLLIIIVLGGISPVLGWEIDDVLE
jgi:hypothetical protein